MRGLGVCKGNKIFSTVIMVEKGMWVIVLVEVDATVGEFAEGSLLLQLCCSAG